jgi:hypothetical protein
MREDYRNHRSSLPLEQVAIPETALETAADVLDRRSKLEHARSRMRKLLRRQPIWPGFMQRIVKVKGPVGA